MTWVKLDDGFTDHPKVVGLTDRAFRVHVRAMCYCGRFSPGVGTIPDSALRQLGATPAVVRELVEARLWEDDGDGLFLHDFAEYHPKPNPEAKAAAGRLGGLASVQAKRSREQAGCLVPASISLQAKSTPDPTRPDPLPSGEARADAAVAATPRISKKKPEIRALTDEQRDRIKADFADIPDLMEEIEFALAHDAHVKCSDENLYLRHWLRGSRERLPVGVLGRNGRSGAMGERPAAAGGRPISDADAAMYSGPPMKPGARL